MHSKICWQVVSLTTEDHLSLLARKRYWVVNPCGQERLLPCIMTMTNAMTKVTLWKPTVTKTDIWTKLSIQKQQHSIWLPQTWWRRTVGMERKQCRQTACHLLQHKPHNGRVKLYTDTVPRQCRGGHISLNTDCHGDSSTLNVTQLLSNSNTIGVIQTETPKLCHRQSTNNASTPIM